MKTTEERLLILEDDLAIRNLAARFADAATIADYGELRATLKPDGIFKINQPANAVKNGADEIVAFIKTLRDTKDFFVQFLHSGVINVTGNTATARWIMHEAGQGPGEKYYSNYGVFNDELEKINGEWVFSSREYDYALLNTEKFDGKPVTLPRYQEL